MAVVQLTIPAVGISETEMQCAFYRSFCSRYELVANNLYLGWCGGEMDIFGLRKSGFIDEIEIKLTASDFKADWRKTVRVDCEPYTPESEFMACSHPHCAKCHGTGITDGSGEPCGYWARYGVHTNKDAPKHEALEAGEHSCNYFSFYLPAELVEKCEIPEYAGLYVFSPDNYFSVQEVKKPKRLHSRKISEHNKYHTARKMHYRYWDLVMNRAAKT